MDYEVTEDVRRRFDVKYIPVTESGCLLWIGGTNENGYGLFYVGGRLRKAHRVAYEMHFQIAIPNDMQIDHLCRVKCCVNPLHLEVVTARENLIRSNSASGVNHRATHCKNGHEFVPENIYRYPDNPAWRSCLTCRYIRSKIFAMKRKLSSKQTKRPASADELAPE